MIDASASPREMPVKRVLLVEDSSTYVFALRKILAFLDVSVTVTGTLAGAREELSKGAFDVVLLDLNLPDSSGLDTLHTILATCDLPTVVITSNDDRSMAAAAILEGADDYLVKGPLDAKILGQTLAHTLERHRFRAKLKLMADELRQKNDRLEKIDQQKNHMLGMAAHDIRNPLGIILGFAKFLRADIGPQLGTEHLAFLDAIVKSSEFVLDLVEKLLDISTIESGKLNIHRVAVDVGQLIRSHVELIGLLAERKQITIGVEIPREQIIINADAPKMEQVLSNLTSNALKFSAARTAIKVCVRATPDTVEFGVEDEGPGIPADELQLLFRPFSTTSVQATAGERSTGLGLAIAQRIVEGHGGEIKVESQVGKGSKFRVILPRS
ncbi:MAG TPA: hybrid sensor histidine kinase/response regulator [Polyangium sp.]|nr:hybrid sensor histidine kinase/response regulator [Polyangium sp.]